MPSSQTTPLVAEAPDDMARAPAIRPMPTKGAHGRARLIHCPSREREDPDGAQEERVGENHNSWIIHLYRLLECAGVVAHSDRQGRSLGATELVVGTLVAQSISEYEFCKLFWSTSATARSAPTTRSSVSCSAT